MTKKIDRRSFLRRVGATAGIGALGVVTGLGATRAGAQITDSDTGANADPAGRSGCTDSDSGSRADRAGNGRCGGGGASGYTDSDSGSMSDPGGNGRGGRRSRPTGLSDADSGSTADRGNYGRGSDR